MPELLAEVEEREEKIARLDDSGGGPPSGDYGDGGGDERPHPRRTPAGTYTIGMIVAMGGSTMFFLALISASVVHKGMPGSDWMPLRPPSLLWLTSAIAIASSFTIVQARRMLKRGQDASFALWWKVSAILGLGFLCGQVLAWRQLVSAGVYMVSNPSVSFFYVFTAAHGLHLLGGVIALLWIGYRQPRVVPRNTSTKVAALYWHFVTALWLVLFSFFLIGG